MIARGAVLSALLLATRAAETLIFEDTFDTFNLSIWKHELTLSGEGKLVCTALASSEIAEPSAIPRPCALAEFAGPSLMLVAASLSLHLLNVRLGVRVVYEQPQRQLREKRVAGHQTRANERDARHY